MSSNLFNLVLSQEKSIDKIVDIKNVANLESIAVQGYRKAVERANQEVGNPTLVFISVLMRTVDTTHAENRRWQFEGAGVVEHILVGCTFRTTVRAVKLERALFTDALAFQSRVDGFVPGAVGAKIE